MNDTTAHSDGVGRLQQIKERARQLAVEWAEGAAARDRERTLPFFAFEQIRAAGIGAIRVPVRFGGLGGDVEDVIEIIAILASGEPNIAHSLRSHFNYTESIFLEADEEQQAVAAERILGGALFGGANTEIGTDRPGDIRTTLSAWGAGYRLNGRKYYATGTAYCDYVTVSAKDEAGAVTRVTLPTGRAGIEILDDWDGMGQRLTASGGVVFADVAVREDEVRKGQKKGLGWRHAATFRQLVLMACQAGIVRRALQDAIDYTRHQARPITHSHATQARNDMFVQRQIGEIAAISHTLDLLIADSARALGDSYRAVASNSDLQEKILDHTAITIAKAQTIVAPFALKVSESIFNVGGASATSRKRNFDRHWRNVRTITSHNPLFYKEQVIGDWLLNETPLPLEGGFF